MTEKEALEILKYYDEQPYFFSRDASANIAFKMAIASIDKQIPKKPIIWEDRWYFSSSPSDDWGYECPCCGNRDIDYPEHHCTCGQALDWRDFD